MIHGLSPGPLLMIQSPELFWGVITSMIVGNALLLVLNLPLIPLWVKVLKVPYRYLFPMILFFCIIGAYSMNNNISDAIVMLIFGIIGYFFRKLGYEPAPLVLALVLSPMFERSLGHSLRISYGNPGVFFTRPISLMFLIFTGLFFLIPSLLRYKQKITEGGSKE